MAFLLTCPYIFAALSFASFLVNNYTITRTSTATFSNDLDIFEVPEAQCRLSSSHCSSYNNALNLGTGGPHCSCTCPPMASTFGHHRRLWSCLNNTQIRAQSGCAFKFRSEQKADPIRILRKNQSPLPTAVLPSRSCFIDMSSSKYFNCDGTWIDFRGRPSSPLKISIKTKLSGFSNYEYSFTVKNVAFLKGKLISLHFRCGRKFGSSCLLFKMEGEFKCSVNTSQGSSTTETPLTKLALFVSSTTSKKVKSPGGAEKEEGDSNRDEKGSSTATVAAVVIIVILVILLVLVVSFILWKKKRGESMWIMDRLTRLAKRQKVEPEENTYAEIHENSHQRSKKTRTDVLTKGILNTHLQQHEDALYEKAEFTNPDEPVTDTEGYLMPVATPLYLEIHPPKETIDNGNANSNDKANKESVSTDSDGDIDTGVHSHTYDVLEEPNAQSTGNGVGTGVLESATGRQESYRGGVRSSAVSSTAVPEPSAAADKKTRQRRLPPSPPRNVKVFSSSDKDNKQDRLMAGPDRHDATEENRDGGALVDNDKANIYESIQEDERVESIYEPLDWTTAPKN